MADPVNMGTHRDIARDIDRNIELGKASALTRLRPAKIRFYLRVMQQQGFSNEQVLSGTGINPRQLADQHYLVEISKYIRIISNINALSGSTSLAFRLGEQLTLGDLGLLGYCVMTCGNTDEATWLWHQYNPVFFGSLIGISIRKVGNQVLVTYVPYSNIREDLLKFLVEEKICCDMALQRLIGIERFPVENLSLTYAEPDNVQCYHELIPCPVQFSASRSTMLLWDNALAIPLQGHDSETHTHCLKLLKDVFESVNAGASLSHRVRHILHENLHQQLSVSQVAERLHCTGRTLNRRLQKEGLNFTDLNVTTRLEAIRNLLATTNLESKALADRVGFSDVHSLRRFFKTHTGMTIQQFRAETTGRSD